MKIANLLITYETSLKIKSSDPTKVIFVSINSHFLQLLPLPGHILLFLLSKVAIWSTH
jgi:hypothetical protein